MTVPFLGNQYWRQYFEGLSFAFGFFGIEEYRKWLSDAGRVSVRMELIPKDMVFQTRKDSGSWIRTTWLPVFAAGARGSAPGIY